MNIDTDNTPYRQYDEGEHTHKDNSETIKPETKWWNQRISSFANLVYEIFGLGLHIFLFSCECCQDLCPDRLPWWFLRVFLSVPASIYICFNPRKHSIQKCGKWKQKFKYSIWPKKRSIGRELKQMQIRFDYTIQILTVPCLMYNVHIQISVSFIY